MNKHLRALFLFLSLFVSSIAPSFATPTNINAGIPVAINSGVLAGGTADMAFTAADVANGNSTVSTGKELIIAYNSGASAYTATVNSTADAYGRSGDLVAYSIAAGNYSVFGPFPVQGWKQSDGTLHFQGSNASVKFMVIRLP